MRGGKSTAKGRTMNRAIAKATKSTGSSRWARVAFQARRERQNLLARRADTWPSSSRAPRAGGGSADAPSAGTGRRGPSHSGSLSPVVLRPLPPPTREPRAALSAGMTARCTRTLRNVLDSEASSDAGGKNGGARRILISWWQQEGPGSPFPGCSEAHDVRANPKQKEQQAADAPRGPLTARSMAPPAPPPVPCQSRAPRRRGVAYPQLWRGATCPQLYRPPPEPTRLGRPGLPSFQGARGAERGSRGGVESRVPAPWLSCQLPLRCPGTPWKSPTGREHGLEWAPTDHSAGPRPQDALGAAASCARGRPWQLLLKPSRKPDTKCRTGKVS